MEPFKTFSAVAAPLDMLNVDTDQVIPARFLSRPLDERYGTYLFHDLRFDADGNEKPDFVMNREGFRGAQVLVADRNFGCGSSRENAVTALAAGRLQGGHRAVLRRHLLQQLAEERLPADPPGRRDLPAAARDAA